jgi:hypothetical protein
MDDKLSTYLTKMDGGGGGGNEKKKEKKKNKLVN